MPQFAVFDTAFHSHLPYAAAIYPGPSSSLWLSWHQPPVLRPSGCPTAAPGLARPAADYLPSREWLLPLRCPEWTLHYRVEFAFLESVGRLDSLLKLERIPHTENSCTGERSLYFWGFDDLLDLRYRTVNFELRKL